MSDLETYKKMTGIDLAAVAREYNKKTGQNAEPVAPEAFRKLYEVYNEA